jgi:hypothetical protein
MQNFVTSCKFSISCNLNGFGLSKSPVLHNTVVFGIPSVNRVLPVLVLGISRPPQNRRPAMNQRGELADGVAA